MYTFIDRNESSLTLRPEHTTPMLRASISNNLLEKLPQKLYGIGPVFRRERPQKGRYRQFNQINFEILGTQDAMADVDIILLADNILKNICPNKKINLHINSLGDKNTLKVFKSALTNYFSKYINEISEESKNKIKTNPIRILDSKNLKDIEINKSAPKIAEFYSDFAKNLFEEVKELLSEVSVDFIVDPQLVRGLDYYCHTVFEFKTDELGSQDTLIGGGRYDGLIKLLGGSDVPGVGWAGGIERIIMLMQNLSIKEKKIYLIVIDEKSKKYSLKIATELRNNNINVYSDYKYNLKKSLSKANQLNFQKAIIIGEDEVRNNTYIIKNLNKNTQETLPLSKINKEIV